MSRIRIERFCCVKAILFSRASQPIAQSKTGVFDWAIGWLARENKIAFTQQNRSIRIRLI